MLEIILFSKPVMIFCGLLIFKPMTCADYIGRLYWHMGKYTAFRKTKDTKKYFIAKSPFWFRILGIMVFLLYFFRYDVEKW